MTEHTGRHASSQDQNETLIMPAIPGQEQPAEAHRAAGRHSSGAGAAEAGQKPARPVPGSGSTWGDRDSGSDWPDTSDRPARHDRPARDDRPSAPGPAASEPRSASPAPATHRNGSRGARPLRLVWVYPDLLSTYGDRGNLLVLMRRAQLRGHEVEPVEVKSDEPVPEDGDIYLLGGGEDLPQILAANRLRADGGLNRAARQGAVVFAVCAGYQLVGHQFGGVDGEPMEGLGIIDVSSGRGEQRGVGEVVADVDPALGVPRLTGFENHQGVTRIGPGARPLARVSLGVGNGDGTEGAYAGKVLGTYLHGPALARNPGLADLLLSWVVGPLGQLDPSAEEWARQLREERLAATAG